MKPTKEDALYIMKDCVDYCMQESCGKCVACRIGSKRMSEILARISAGEALPWDVNTLDKLSKYMEINSLCGTGKLTAKTMNGLIAAFNENA